MVVDIPPHISDATSDPGSADQLADPPNPLLEPEETIETNTTESAETETLPLVLETRRDSTAWADPEPCDGLSAFLETEGAPEARPDAVPDSLPTDQMEPGTSDDSPEALATSHSSNPNSGLLETLVGSQSPIPLPHRGTRPHKQPERYAPVCKLNVLPIKQAQTGPSIWLFPTIGVAVTLSTALPAAPLTL